MYVKWREYGFVWAWKGYCGFGIFLSVGMLVFLLMLMLITRQYVLVKVQGSLVYSDLRLAVWLYSLYARSDVSVLILSISDPETRCNVFLFMPLKQALLNQHPATHYQSI